MRYILLVKNRVTAEAVNVMDLCHIVAAYSGESYLNLEIEFFENGYLKRGDLWISYI